MTAAIPETLFTALDHAHMAHALQLAARGLYTTSPNPRVGCVIAVDDMVIGSGWHQRAGGPHAEVHALQAAGERARGATAYVTLEPCSHHGRTPPCADALVAAGVKRVVAAMRDPNPLVAGCGLARLEAHGIEVGVGLMAAQARELNPGFVMRMESGRPWVRAKIAASLDGGTALGNGTSQWITGPAARQDTQHWRARACAILSGAGTVLADDPQLNVRAFEIGRQPLRVIADSHLRTPSSAKVLQGGALLACRDDKLPQAEALRMAGADLLVLPDAEAGVDLGALLQALGQRGVNELHVEAGARLTGELLRRGLVDELLFYLAPVLLGSGTRPMFDMPALQAMSERTELDFLEVAHVGPDLRIRARPR